MIHGKGYNSGDEYKTAVDGRQTKAYRTWLNLLVRCYSGVHHAGNAAYKGCTVCDEWHDYQIFAKWHADNYEDGCSLALDIKVEGNKIYTPEFCNFIALFESNENAKVKTHIMVSPEGAEIEICNLAKFSRENNLDLTCLASAVDFSQHKDGARRYAVSYATYFKALIFKN